MKKKIIFIMIAAVLAVIAVVVGIIAMQDKSEPGPEITPTMQPTVTVAPTDPVPTNTLVPTLAPSAEPTVAPVPAETNTPVPTMAPQETLTPTPEPTAEPTPTPTELPHEHSWTKKAVFATCGAEGRSWEECACGAVQNEVITPKEEHKKCNYRVIKEPTVTEEGTYETSCDECGTVVASGTIPKLTPTPVPTSTPTPKPTATPKPVCGHGSIETTLVKETDTELVYQDICELCGEVISTRNVAKATPTPKPTATPTPTIPLPTPTPVPELGEVVSTYIPPETEYESYKVIEYENMTVEQTFYKDGDTNVFDYTYSSKDDSEYYNESLWECEQFDGTFTVKYYLFIHNDFYDSTKDYCRLVNSDGSMNKFSVHTFTGTEYWPTTQKGWAGEWPDMWQVLLWIRFEGKADSGQEVYISPEEFYSFEGKEGHLYEY